MPRLAIPMFDYNYLYDPNHALAARWRRRAH